MLPLATQVTEAQLEKLLSDFVSNMEPDNAVSYTHLDVYKRQVKAYPPEKVIGLLGKSLKHVYPSYLLRL